MNVFTFSAGMQRAFNEYCAENGYTAFTTFASDLAIASWYGKTAIRDTYRNVMRSWLDSIKYITEFNMALNFLAWYWNDKGDMVRTELFCELYDKSKNRIYRHYKEDEEATSYFFQTTD